MSIMCWTNDKILVRCVSFNGVKFREHLTRCSKRTDMIGTGQPCVELQAAPLVCAVVINWNRPDDTLLCLASLRRQEGIFNLEPIVIDNGSSDNSVERIRNAFPGIELLEAGRNVGFASGMNLGIRQALKRGADYALLLNNDTIADPAMLDQLLKQAASGVGLMAPAIFYADQPDRIWSVGGGFSSILLEATGNHGRHRLLPDRPVERGFLSGCALLIHREVFEKVGLFDERFFMYYEDLDFCLRAQRAGYCLWLVPKARLWHKVSLSSGGANSPAERYHMAFSSALYFRKYARGWRLFVVIPYRLMSALRWTVRLGVRGNWQSLSAYWRGLRDGLMEK